MSIHAFSAAYTISDTTPDNPAAFQFYVVLIDSLTMELPINQGIPLTV